MADPKRSRLKGGVWRTLSLPIFLGVLLALNGFAAHGESAPIPRGDLLFVRGFASGGLLDFDSTGVLRQTIAVPNPYNTFSPGEAMASAVDPTGRLHVFNGYITAALSTYDSDADLWTHHTIPDWSTYGCVPCQAVESYGSYLFVNDPLGTFRSLIRWDTADYSTTRFGQGNEYDGLCISQGTGTLFAWRHATVYPYPPTVVDVYALQTLAFDRTITLDTTVVWMAADEGGSLYGVGGRSAFKFDTNGARVAQVDFPFPTYGAFYGIAAHPDGRFALANDDGRVIVTDHAFNVLAASPGPSTSGYHVAFARAWRVAPASFVTSTPFPTSVHLSDEAQPPLTVNLESTDGAFDPTQLVADSTVVGLTPADTTQPGMLVGTIVPDAVFPSGESNNNGRDEFGITLSGSALRDFFQNVFGTRVVSMTAQGALTTGARWRGTFDLQVVGRVRAGIEAVPRPSPFRGKTILSFVTSLPGRVRAHLYDTRGRVVRVLLDEGNAAAGFHDVSVDADGGTGPRLPSGLYFYKIETPEGKTSGRLALLR